MSYRSEVLADSPTAYWRLGETSGTTAADEVAAHAGTYVNTPTLGVSGAMVTNPAASFDLSQSEHVLTTTLGTLGGSLITSSWEFWIKTNSTASSAAFGSFNTGTTQAVQVLLNRSSTDTVLTGSTMFYIRGADGKQTRCALTTNIYDDAWHHVVMVVASTTTFEIYIDKTLQTPTYTIQQAPISYANWEFPITLAARNLRGVLDNYATIALDEVAFYPTRLTSTRVAAHFDAAALEANDPALNTNVNLAVGDVGRVRFEVQETGGAAVATAYKLRYSKNSGAYADVGSATDCQYAVSGAFADGAATTDLLPSGTGTFVAGEGSEDAVTASVSLGASGHTEHEFAFKLGAGVVAGDTFDLRVYRSDGTPLDTYTNTPRVTATGGATTTPISGVEAFTLSEASSIAITFAGTDAGTLTDTRTLQAQSSVTDTVTATDIALVVAQLSLAVNDATTLSDISAVAQCYSVTETTTLSDASAVLQSLALAVSDANVFSDLSQLSSALAAVDSATQADAAAAIGRDLAVLDSNTFSELSALAASLSVSDLDTLAEAVAVLRASSVTDAWALTDSSATATQLATTESFSFADVAAVASVLALVASDSLTLSEALQLSQLALVSDPATQSDASSLSVAIAISEVLSMLDAAVHSLSFSVVDVFSFTELASLLAAASFSVVDAVSVADASSVAAALALNDPATHSEASSYSGLLAALDSATQSDASSLGGETAVTVSDSSLLSDSSALLMTLALIAQDSLTLADASAIGAAVAAVDDAVQSAGVSMAAAIGVAESLGLSDIAALQQTLFVPALDSFATDDLALIAASLELVDAGSVSEASSKTEQQLKAVFDSFVLAAEQAIIAVGLQTHPVHLPTRAAIRLWAAAATVRAVALSHDVDSVVLGAALVSNIKQVSLETPTLRVELAPHRTSVTIG